jgi:uncharacterized protein (TIGR01777 family)
MRILMAGSSGFLGTALRTHLAAAGHDVTRLVRSEPTGPDQVRWDPYRAELDLGLVDRSDVVVNLAGAKVEHWPWTSSYKQQLLDSRVTTTSVLAEAIATVDRRPALINASGVNIYGDDRGDEELTEDASDGPGLLADVVRAWEGAAETASEAGARVVLVRGSAILDKNGGVLKVVRLPFWLGIGGRVADGRQWFSSLSLPDYVAAVTRLIGDDSMDGPYNVSAPVPTSNRGFTKALGRRLNRPTVLVVPGFAMRLATGDMGNLVLGSRRILPARLLAAGFEFAHPTIEDQLEVAF